MRQLGNVPIDSKVMKANASADRIYTEKKLIEEQKGLEKAIQEYLEKANQREEEGNKKYVLINVATNFQKIFVTKNSK